MKRITDGVIKRESWREPQYIRNRGRSRKRWREALMDDLKDDDVKEGKVKDKYSKM